MQTSFSNIHMKALNHRAPNLLAPHTMMRILNGAGVATAERWSHQLKTNAVRGEEMPASPTRNCLQQLVLDAHVRDVAMNYRADVMAANPNRDNDGFRHAAYRQYIL